MLRQQIATVLCPRFPHALEGLDFGDGGERPLPGGFCVFRADLPASLETVAGLRQERGGAALPYLCSDLERGAGQQVPGLTRLPPALALGAAGSADLARRAGSLTALEARAAGIQVVFAPVLDVGDEPRNPIIAARSFGADPRRVAELGAAWIEGCLAEGALPVGKHYPGHGATLADSHIELPVLRRSEAAWREVDEPPFRAALAAGVPALMMAHVHAPFLDAPEPMAASLSRAVVEARLRGDLGFQGVVFTDALDMGALARERDRADPAVRALLAGCDVALIPGDAHGAARALEQAVLRGLLPRRRLEQAASRVLEMVARARAAAPFAIRPHAQGEALAREIARRSVVRVAGAAKTAPPPLSGRDVEIALVEDAAGEAALPLLLDGLRRHGVRARRAQAAPHGARLPRVVAVFSDVRAHKGRVALDGASLGLVERLLAASGEACLLSVGPPQALGRVSFPGPAWYVFDDDPASLEAAAAALAGALDACGTACWIP
ncbi:MAG: glycoside hydrolase family 3 protein [Planctomycetes bacterium]|nr:glycoside hydrolase family 3 protein [Planctomycetota bacterium]